MLHKELVDRSSKWLKNTRKCPIVVTELVSSALSESPDAMGWKTAVDTILIECKTSRADFLKDKQKPFRQFWDMGVGQTRFYITPPNLIAVSELPEGWGLLYCHPTKIQVVHEVKPVVYLPAITFRESNLLYSMVRRAMSQGFDVTSAYLQPNMVLSVPHVGVQS